MVAKADIYLSSYPFDVAYIIAGVNDITEKNRATGSVHFTWACEDTLAGHLIATLKNSYVQLTKDHPGAKVIFCPLVGLDLHKQVRSSTVKQQQMVNNAVWRYNIELNKMKDEHGFCFPYLASPIHRSENGKHKSYYHHLSTDGLHLTTKLYQTWATQLVKAFDRN